MWYTEISDDICMIVVEEGFVDLIVALQETVQLHYWCVCVYI